MSDKVFPTVFGLHHARDAWVAISNRSASDSSSRVQHLRRQLQNLHQGSQNCTDYIVHAKNIVAQLGAVGKVTEDDDLITYMVSGLTATFNPFVTSLSFACRYKALSFEYFQAELLSYELLTDNQNQSLSPDSTQFAMYSSKPNPQNFNRKSRYPPKSQSRSFPSPRTAGTPATPQSTQSSTDHQTPSSPCQICGKLYHRALDCFHRMDHANQGRHPPAQLSAMVAHSNPAPINDPWYADSGANQHITSNLENLSLQQPYTGSDNVAVGNGSGLRIHNTGSLQLHTPNSTLHLHNVLHCPKAFVNLLSINKFCRDNSCFFILTILLRILERD